MSVSTEGPLGARVSRAELVARPSARLAMSHVVLGFSIDRAEFSDFDGAAMVAVHRDLVEAIEAHQPTVPRTPASSRRMRRGAPG
jgi:hypothetical protein